MDTAQIISFPGKNLPKHLSGVEEHPAPWRYENGFIWDARGRVVGSTVLPDTAAWIVRLVNASADADQA